MSILRFIGSEFSYWSGGYARNGVATLMCFSLNNYHSVTDYTWHHNNTRIVGSPFSILYSDKIGGSFQVRDGG